MAKPEFGQFGDPGMRRNDPSIPGFRSEFPEKTPFDPLGGQFDRRIEDGSEFLAGLSESERGLFGGISRLKDYSGSQSKPPLEISSIDWSPKPILKERLDPIWKQEVRLDSEYLDPIRQPEN